MNSDDGIIQIGSARIERRLEEARAVRRCAGGAACRAACCRSGVYISVEQSERILHNHEKIAPFLRPNRRNPDTWFDGSLEADSDHPHGGMLTGTNVMDDPHHPSGRSCVFLTEHFHCGIQAASIAHQLGPWEWKPFYCVLYPLTYEKGVLRLDDESRMWQEGIRCCETDTRSLPLIDLLRDELLYALGEEGLRQLRSRL
jgi:hypothetical protein